MENDNARCHSVRSPLHLTLLEFFGAGDEIADVLEEHPPLTREDVLACLCYSLHLMGKRFTP